VALPYGAVKKGALRECMENPPCRITADVNKMAMPDFGDYFAALKENSLTETISPALTVEFSRGCWWGEKNACTFCGLNGSINRYRAKTSERVLAELTALKEKYSMTDFVLTDNILSYQHQKELLPKLKGKGYRFFSEVKSNLTAEGLADLKAAGFLWLQPGIESLQDDILRLMNKGNKAIRHVELLKNMREQGIAAFWGIIGGFPLEKEEWLEEMAELLPKLTHLQPPTSFRPMIVQRYNEYWRNPDKYNISLRPSPLYDFVCPDIENLAATLAYNFVYTDEKMQRQTLHLKLRGGVYAKISAQIAAWQAGFSESPDRLTMKDDGEKIEIMDLRTIAKKSLYTLTGKTREIYRRTKSAAAEARLIADFSQEEQREVKEEIEKLVADGLMIRIGGDLLALAVRDDFSPYDEKFPGRLLKRS
jgi:magnesium-protoporphyrin IX monomethyl ester (oxidative) cyclase